MILETLSLTVRPQSSGEPDAGKPPVWFGGRGDFNTVVPTPILHTVPTGHRPYRYPVFQQSVKLNSICPEMLRGKRFAPSIVANAEVLSVTLCRAPRRDRFSGLPDLRRPQIDAPAYRQYQARAVVREGL